MSEPPRMTQTASGNYIAQAAAGGTAVVNVYEHVPPRPADPAALQAAEQLLANMPVDRVPDLAPLPLGSRMALRHNPLFVGREDALLALAAALTGAKIAAVTGLGGVGKTQLASEFVHRNGHYFAGGVFWLSFAEGAAVPSEIAACGGVGHLDLRPDFAGLSLEDQVRAVLAAWASPIPRLLIFDNCESPELLDRWRPPTGGCRVLLTSRRPAWPVAFAVRLVPLAVLAREHSVTLLQKHLHDAAVDPNELSAIALELGDLPLALHLAGSVLVQYREAITPAAYLQRLREPALLDAPWLRSNEPSPTGHVQQVAVTFALSYQQLELPDSMDTRALGLLARAAHLAPGEPIPRDLLIATAELSKDETLALLECEDALTRLVALGLLERGATGTFRLHRLLIAFVRTREADTGAQAAVERAVVQIAIERSGEASLSALLALQPHLRRVTDVARERGDIQAARLCMVLGDHLMKLADYLEAKVYYSVALAIRQERLGDRDADTVSSLHAVGLAHKERGEYAEGQRYFERALAAIRKAKGIQGSLKVASLDSLAFILKDQGRYTEAQRHFEQALKITKALQGEHDPETAVRLNNLGLVFKDQGDHAKAQRYFEQALKICLAAPGGEKTGTVACLNNLAFLVKDQGRYAEAQGYFEQALAINETAWGDQHLETIISLNNLAFVLVDQAVAARRSGSQEGAGGLFADARRYLERALASQERMFPEGHPRRADGLESLGEVLSRQGDREGAQGYLERALAIRLQVLGEWHVDTARNMSSLGRVIAAQPDQTWSAGHLTQARSYLERSVAAFAHSLGPTHDSPDAARARALLEDVETRIRANNDLVSAIMAASLG
jgi:tetratricopeptide (TPR) repeat protein